MERVELGGEVRAGERRVVEHLGFAPAHGQAVHEVVRGGVVEEIEEAAVRVRSVVHDDVGVGSHTTRLLDVERRLARAGLRAELCPLVDVDLLDAVLAHSQPDRAPVVVRVGGVEVGQGRDADGRAGAVDAGSVQRVHVVVVGEVADRVVAGHAGRRSVRGEDDRGRVLRSRRLGAGELRREGRLVREAGDDQHHVRESVGDTGRACRAVIPGAAALVVVQGEREGLGEGADGAGGLEHQIVRERRADLDAEGREVGADAGDVVRRRREAPGELVHRQEAMVGGGARLLRRLDELLQLVIRVDLEDDRHGHHLRGVGGAEIEIERRAAARLRGGGRCRRLALRGHGRRARGSREDGGHQTDRSSCSHLGSSSR